MKNPMIHYVLALGLFATSASPGMAQSVAHPRTAHATSRTGVPANTATGSPNATPSIGNASQPITRAPLTTDSTAAAGHQANGAIQSAGTTSAKVCRTDGSTVYFCN
jgi:hypothetical protein